MARELNEAEYEELEAFLQKHHPPLYAELVMMREKGIRAELPHLHQLLLDDVRRFRAGKPTRNVQFLA